MANYFTDNDDLQYYFERGIDWEPIVRLTEYDYRTQDGYKSASEALEFYRDATALVGRFVAEEVAPHAAEIDRQGAHFKDGDAIESPRMREIFQKIKELDLHWSNLPREFGGMNSPLLLYFIHTELFARADVSVMSHFGFHGGMAMAMLGLSIREGSTEFDRESCEITKCRFREYIEEIGRGDAWSCMDITEPDAGSDMAALRCSASQNADGAWEVSGQKIFITSGHAKYHFVIARTEKASSSDDPMAGLAGMSMFLVPTYRDNEDGTRAWISTLDRVEEKLGHHGSVTAAMSFDRTPAHLIGERGEGFKHMLTLMNGARLSVGFETIGLCEAAYRLAAAYAAERPSMGKTIDRHELIADYLEEMRTDIQGLRAIAVFGAWHEEQAQKQDMLLRLDPPEDELARKKLARAQRRHKAVSRRVTPLLKYLGAEKAVEMARRCLQIHGGNGYMTEYGAEKLLRDALVMPIYEGTSQIQALMAMKDTLGGIIKNPQGFVRKAAQARWRALSARDPLERRVAKVQQLSLSTQQHLMARTAADKFKSVSGRPVSQWSQAFLKDWNPKRDFAYALLHAERLTRLLTDELICEVLLDQAKRHPERRELLERYLERAEPRVRFLHEEITTTGQRLLRTLADRERDASEAAAS
ncbi:MAG: acyl-CoA dehydrogenase family protein [Myxococcales bacterium]|nr:acyl-CoA dehydrogenase family protein [Myxococcales bacterium]